MTWNDLVDVWEALDNVGLRVQRAFAIDGGERITLVIIATEQQVLVASNASMGGQPCNAAK